MQRFLFPFPPPSPSIHHLPSVQTVPDSLRHDPWDPPTFSRSSLILTGRTKSFLLFDSHSGESATLRPSIIPPPVWVPTPPGFTFVAASFPVPQIISCGDPLSCHPPWLLRQPPDHEGTLWSLEKEFFSAYLPLPLACVSIPAWLKKPFLTGRHLVSRAGLPYLVAVLIRWCSRANFVGFLFSPLF